MHYLARNSRSISNSIMKTYSLLCVAKRVEKKVGTRLRKNICNALKQTSFKTKQTVICISPRGYLSPQISKNHHWTSLGQATQTESETRKLYLLTTKYRVFRSTANPLLSVTTQHSIKKRELSNICDFVTESIQKAQSRNSDLRKF